MTAAPARPRSALRVLARRNFAPFFAGNLLSNCGTWFQNIAQALLIYRLTHSSLLVGVANFAQFAGVILLAPWAGAAADRWDRRRLIVATQVGAMAVTGTLAALSAAGRGSVHVIIALALVLGATTAFSTPALQAILPSLVEREDVHAAIAMNSVTFNLARAVGPVLGALVVSTLGIPTAFGLNCLSYAALIVGVLLVHPRPHDRSGARPRLRDSVRILRENRDLAMLLGVVAAVSWTMDPINTLTPAFSTQVFHRPDTLTGWLIGAFGVGAVAASVLPARHREGHYRVVGWMLAVLGAGMLAFAFSPTLPLAYVALAVGGFGYLSGQTRATTLLQLEVKDEERGRIMALWSVAFLGSRPLASLVDGALAGPLGPHGATAVMAVPAFIAAAVLLLWRPRTPSPAPA